MIYFINFFKIYELKKVILCYILIYVNNNPMLVNNNMVETKKKEVETSGATGARASVKCMKKLELKMRMEKCVDVEDKMMLAIKEMGVEGSEWFVI